MIFLFTIAIGKLEKIIVIKRYCESCKKLMCQNAKKMLELFKNLQITKAQKAEFY
jgi:hypothetical protein